MKKETLSRTITIVLSSLLVIAIVFILLLESGVFKSDPKVEMQPDGQYTEVLTVITDSDYRPYSFFDADGKASGHDVELITIIANELHMKLDLRLLDWYDGIDEITNGNADVLMTCDYSDTFEGVDRLIKSEPTSYDDFIVYSKTRISSPDEIYGKRIAIMRNGNVTAQIRMMNLEKNCKLYDNNEQAMRALINDEVDFAVMRQTVGTVLLQELNAKGIEGYVSIGQSFMCFGISAQNPEIAEKINSAIEKMKADGEMEKLRQKWLTTFIRPYTFRETIENNVWVVILFLVLAIIAVIILSVLNRNKHKREKEQLQNAQVVEQLAHDFSCVNYVEITDKPEMDLVVNFRVSKELDELIPGWSNEKLFMRKLLMLRDTLVYELDRPQFTSDIRRDLVLTKLQKSEVYYINTRLYYDGSVRYFQMKFTAVKENGEIKAVVAGLHSVDEQTRKEMEMQQQLEEALSMAQSSNRAKTTFLNNMSHDIRTPMNAIIGYTELAEKHLDDRTKVKDYLGKIEQSSNHLLSLINDVLDMSRIESGKVNLDEKATNLPEIVRSLHTILEASIQAKQHSFSVEMVNIPDENVLCDRLRLNQILLNILSNAIKYTPDGGKIAFCLTEKEKKSSGYATYEFLIKDNGIGMDEEYLKTIFEPFTRVKSSTVSGIQGTGLGMAITKNLVDMMGGKIEISSRPGEGTEIAVVIDFRTVSDASENAQKAAEPHTELDFRGKKILLVEDNALNSEIATEILTEEGFVVDNADDGDVAVEIIRNAKTGDYDLILMDIQMPRMNGYEATQLIRSLGTEISKIPILAMTANAFEEDRKLALKAGMNDHIAKPIEIGKLNEALAKFL